MDRGYTLPPEGKRNLFESIPQGSGFRTLPLAHIHALLNRLHSAPLFLANSPCDRNVDSKLSFSIALNDSLLR